jgi:hypothetical protein
VLENEMLSLHKLDKSKKVVETKLEYANELIEGKRVQRQREEF